MKSNSANTKRIISGIILILIVGAILIFGNKYLVDVVCGAISILALREYFNANSKHPKEIRWIAYLFSIYMFFLHIIPIQITILLAVAFVPLCVTMLMLTVIFSNMKINLNDIAIELFGICYIIGFIIFIPLLYGMPHGKITIWYLIFVACGTDIVAYFVGCKFGKHKFTKISPNKSIEGCIAGVIGAVIFVTIYTVCINNIVGATIPYGYMIFVGIILSLVGQCGDLAASSIKRYTGIKDFGNLIPGHGGILDRIDSIIFMAPIAYVLLMII